ncbi:MULTISPECIES: family 78 glycoside hydrolase catalytic domain [unclassified Streptomyces]|uniref:family 78 glycoside hydrolase catalytic domain n=1 Tax=unclassified Streptomyces TaxID=2593676 RepID=UPI000F6CBDBB|nr:MULTISPECIES: family 78 glycoside hydrolase catalytic domain [unclassified Streptomyces]AZM64016.1 hydrolase [Streptomyces sp. WAC 01438]RSM88105.1 hydrolase [Streptomyces sp. WAC 01420]
MAEGWKRRVFLQGTVAAGVGLGAATAASQSAAAPSGGPGAGGLRIVRTGAEYAETLLGTDVERPRLSWELTAPGRGARQSAYRIQVVRDRARWDGRKVWDSGKVDSDRTVGVAYDGPALLPRTRYYWRVRVWDARGRASRWSEPRWWETTLSDDDWQARWIGADAPPQPPSFEGASWIWSPDAAPDDAPEGPRWFRYRLALPEGTAVRRAVLVATGDDDFTLHIDGRRAAHAPEQRDGWRTGRTADVTGLVRAAPPGDIVLAAVATNRAGASVNPAGLLVRLLVDTADGETHELVTGDGWRVAATEQPGWERRDFDDGAWAPAAVLAPYGQGPWGSDVSVPVPEQPAPLLRRSFTVRKRISRARLYISGLAYYEAHLNGRRIGRQVLDPGFTDYDETVLYAVHDVTRLLERGENALGVTLGRGFYGMTTPNVWNWHRAPWHGEPRLIAQLEIDHPDGSRTTVVSDGEWRMTEGPTRSDSLYAGETFDARLSPAGWTRPGFDDSAWRPAGVQDAPAGTLRAQAHEPVGIVETVRPTKITELRPGVYVVDMGRTMAGWTRLTVRDAAAGAVVRLAHGEKLEDDGSVHVESDLVPGRFQTDEYVCAGGGEEVWEPSFSYKGFRYVQISGLPARPSPGQVLGRVVHSEVEEVSDFACSEPFYEWLDGAMRRTVLNNLHGIPTDTPIYEKNGWTGDAQLGTPVMAYAFGMHRFLSKWLGDLADSQTPAGQLPVIVPSGGWGYRDAAPSPEWTTVYPFVVREMYRVYGDERVAREHWDTLVRYLDWELNRLEGGLAVTALGDYLPPGYGGNPPEDTRLTATAYLHRALLHTAETGDLLGERETAARYRKAADALRDAFNAAFLGPAGHYRTAKDPGYRQTSNAVPLAFGLVPPGARASVLDSLVRDIEERGNHLNTGALGTSVLLRVLCAHGRPDVAHAVATQRTYPSWGYWRENGADTMWEMWPLDSRSRDHYFQGTVVQWLYENVAGLRPGDAGYRTFVVRPDARTGVDWARTSIRTVRGTAAVSWTRIDGRLRLTVRVPVGATADVHVPGGGRSRVTAPAGAEILRTEPGFVVHRVPHGTWEFTGRA